MSFLFSSETPEQRAEVGQFDAVAHRVIDEALPELLGGMYFENALAAISFAHDIFIKLLTEHPDLFRSAQLENELRQHLQAVIARLPVADDGEEDEEDDDDDDEERREPKTMGKTDKRYLAALVRVKGPKQENTGDSPLDLASKRHTDTENKLFDKALEGFEKEFPAAEAAKPFIELAKGVPRDRGVRLLKLLVKLKHDGVSAPMITEVNRTFDMFGLQTHGPEREERTKNLVALGLMGALDAEKIRTGATTTSDRIADMSEYDREVSARKQKNFKEIKELQNQEKLASDKAKQAQAQRQLEEHTALWLATPGDVQLKLKAVDEGVDKPSASSVLLLRAVAAKLAKRAGVLELFEDYFAARSLEPGSAKRLAAIDALANDKLLTGVDTDVLKYGRRSAKKVVEAAKKGGWATRAEIDMGSRLLGPAAFTGILDSHMRRGKPGPLRAMIEQIRNHHTDLVRLAPPLTSTSLVLDTNMVETLITPPERLSDTGRHLRQQLNALIAEKGITDVRLANMNIAELSGFGRLIGTVQTVELNPPEPLKPAPVRKLQILGVPYHGNRGSGRYAEVFKHMEEKKVGENKGDADRSMMADVFMAEREKDAVPSFATADLGVAEEIGKEPHQFNPSTLGLPSLDIRTMAQPGGKADAKGADKEAAPERKGGHPIWDFPVGAKHTVRDVLKLIQERGFRVYVVGGAVRDFVRKAGKIKDVDLKTDMPVDLLEKLMQENHLNPSVTQAIKLVKVGQDEASVDIVSTTLSSSAPQALDLAADARTRDFTLNALYLDPSARERDKPIGSDARTEHARSGLLRFSADPGPDRPFKERAQAILQHLSEKPENFGRALKFIERGHQQWLEHQTVYREKLKEYENRLANWKRNSKKKKKRGPQPRKPEFAFEAYHLDAEVLDLLRKNAAVILAPLQDKALGPSRKGLFIHQSGFKAPMEVVDVMRRLNFPPEAIRLVYPDTIAGSFHDGMAAFSREVTPRFRSVGAVSDWDPKAAPSVKVDVATGRIYQYRIYAYTDVGGSEHKLLIDVDYSDHDVKGHPSPHYHLYRDIGGVWKKKQEGFSKTGQPGEPPVKMVGGRREYFGPKMWTWWGFDPANHGKAEDVRAALKQAAKDAGISYEEKDGMVHLGGHLTVPFKRVQELVRDQQMPKVLQLVHNLAHGHGWNRSDDTVQHLTSSGKERLRFKPQLESAFAFLRDTCGIADPDKLSAHGKLNEEELARIYDLENSGISVEMARAAARYAHAKLASPNAFEFVNLFEYYVAATKNKVERTALDNLHKRTVTHATNLMSGGAAALASADDLPGQLQRSADKLHFKDTGTAAYHLHKHIDLVQPKASELHLRKPMRAAMREYMEICRSTVKDGQMKKEVSESATAVKFYFEKDGTVAIVEVDTAKREAHLLTCYDKNVAAPVFLTTPASQPQTGGKGGKNASVGATVQYYRTPFGTYERIASPNDGDCFFHSVRASGNLGPSAHNLRLQAAQELSQHHGSKFNGTTYLDFITRSGTAEQKVAATVRYLSTAGNWSHDDGDLVPELMARALGRTIHILSSSTGTLVQTMGPANSNPIVIFYNGGTHYDTARQV
ncbi:MAG TPA: hypothetical protein VFF16_13875 [Telluria sp.]|nr:hypothetical protein [Telluria sp.]